MPDRWVGKDFYPSGATEPVQTETAVDSTAGTTVIKKEPASKQGPVGAKGKPRKAASTKTVGKKK